MRCYTQLQIKVCPGVPLNQCHKGYVQYAKGMQQCHEPAVQHVLTCVDTLGSTTTQPGRQHACIHCQQSSLCLTTLRTHLYRILDPRNTSKHGHSSRIYDRFDKRCACVGYWYLTWQMHDLGLGSPLVAAAARLAPAEAAAPVLMLLAPVCKCHSKLWLSRQV